ncbi:MAG TPA: ABC transporter permease [Gemmatimonadaceae bacterium]|nr:ABC transporter permease [Gemmatimonadaceae bacterium]
MIRFLARRIGFALLVLWVVATAVFLMYFVAPHNVARLIAGRQATAETVALVRHRLGLDLPVPVQYGRFLLRLAHGDLGYSFVNSESIGAIIRRDLPVTASLALGGAVLWLVIGVGAGVLAAKRPRSALDRVTTGLSLFFYSMPTFLLGELFLLFLFFRLYMAGIRFFPPSGYVPLSASVGEWARHLILPWLTIALVTAATYSRLVRGSMLDVLGEDYIKTARSKGLSERRVTYRHALRSALTPALTQFGIDLGTLLGGAIVTEQVFGLPGLGREAVLAITTEDLPLIIGIVILASAFVVVANIVVDMLYAVLDPRVRVES